VAQAEPKLFPVPDRGRSAALWKLASGVLAVITLGAAAFGYQEYDAVRTLRAQLTESTAAARQAASEDDQLRSQLSAAQDRINSQGTKLTAAEQHQEVEEQQLTAAQYQALAEQRQLSAAEQQVQKEKHELQDVREQLAAESRPDLPVRLLFLDAARAGAKVAVLQNLSNAEVDLTLDVQSPGSSAHARKQLVLAARGVLRMGPAQGWTFTPGQVVTLDSAKFRRVVQSVS